VAKRAMMHLDIFRTASSPAAGRRRGRFRLIAASAVCSGTLLAFGTIAVAADSSVPAQPAAVPAKAAPAKATPAKATPAVAVGPEASCPAAADSRPMSHRAFNLLERLRTGGDGARARLRELSVREVSRNALADQVLRQNLTVQSSAESIAVAKALVTQSDAVFDPTLFSTLSYTNRYGNPRRDIIGRFYDQDPSGQLQADNDLLKQQAIQQGTDPNASEGSPQCLPSVSVDGEVTSPASAGCQLPPVYMVQPEFASTAYNSDHKVTGSLGLAINFIIGGSANLAVSSTWHKPPAMSTSGVPSLTTPAYPDDASNPYDPYGWNQKLFWTSSASMSVTMPLPWTKNFGFEGNPNYYNYQVAQSSERKSGWSDKASRNGTLEQALQGYWDVVQSVQTLRALAELREVLADRGASQKRLFDNGLATRYELSQIEVQQSSLDSQEETAWGQLLTSSNRLGTLVAGDQRALMLPADAETLLRLPVALDQVAGAYGRALDLHPSIKAQEEDYNASKLSLAFRENQDLPDLSVSASFSVGQSDSAWGYESLPASMAHLVAPDTSNFFVGIKYHVPIGMNATGAALDRARITERQAFDRTRLVRQQVVNAVDQATGAARSAQSVVRQSEDDLKLAQCSYDRARDQRDLGLVAEFEVLNKYQDLVTARLGLITAQVNFRKAYVHLLAAQGTLEQDYVR